MSNDSKVTGYIKLEVWIPRDQINTGKLPDEDDENEAYREAIAKSVVSTERLIEVGAGRRLPAFVGDAALNGRG